MRWIWGGQQKRFAKSRTFHFSVLFEKMDSKAKKRTFEGSKV